MASLDLEDLFSSLPIELSIYTFQYLAVEDLCRVATCSRTWREAANSNVLWRPLCRQKGWERYGTVTDLCKETPFAPASQEQDKDQGSDIVSFPNDLLVNGSAWPGLVDTCKWKEVYMKARHLEANWRNNRYHVVSFEFGAEACYGYSDNLILQNLDGEGSFLAGGISNSKVRIWDVTNGHCRHIIEVDASNERHALKMKNGVIAAGCKDGKIRTYSVQTGELLHVLSGHRLAVTRLFFDGETIVSGAEKQFRSTDPQPGDSDVRVWSSADGSSRFVLQSVSHSTQLVNVDYLDKTVAVAYDDNTIRLWDVLTGTCKRTIATGAYEIISCHLGSGFVISAGKGNDVRMWNFDSGECMKKFDVSGLNYECFNPTWDILSCMFNGELLVVESDYNYNLRIFNLDGQVVEEISEIRLAPICIHGNKLVTVTTDNGVNELYLIDQLRGFTLLEGLRGAMDMDPYFDGGECYTVAWMSDTKLAFVKYYDRWDKDANLGQIPKIFVYHYW